MKIVFIKLFKAFAVLILFVVFLANVLLPRAGSRDAPNRSQCKNNLKQILLALHNYESIYSACPPAHTVDANGKPLHSWRTLILPFLDHQKLYDSIDLSKPWDDPVNAKAHRSVMQVYRCPLLKQPAGKTTYLAVVTPESFLQSTEPSPWSKVSDALAETLMIIEVAPEHAVHWMAPVDADEQIVLNFAANQKQVHLGGTHVGMANGVVRFISFNTDKDTLRALITCAGDDRAGDF